MVLPLSDGLPTRRSPVVTKALIAANVLILLWQMVTGHQDIDALRYGFVPYFLFHGLPDGYTIGAVSPALSLITYAFLHSGWLHLGGNMLFLWIFGNNVEDVLGRLRYLLFYLASAAVGALLEGLAAPASTGPLVGASAAVAGILAGYLVLFPHQRVITLVGIIPLPLPAFLVIGIWLVFQVIDGVSGEAARDHVAWLAHLGGFAFGYLVIRRLRPRPSPGPWG